MTQDDRPKDPFLRDLQSVLNRDLPPTELAQSYSRLRLQPVAVPPPPGADGYDRRSTDVPPASALSSVSADDDLSPDEALESPSRLRWPLIIAAAVLASGAGALGFLMYSLSYGPPDTVAVPQAIPEIRADPAAAAKAPPPVETQPSVKPETATALPAAPQNVPTQPVSMGQVSTDLIAPSTEGLSPARKIGTIRILVEGDKEIGALR
jgi:hypothetical protein